MVKVGLNLLTFLAPPDKILRWIESKLNLLGRLPHYVSIDQKTYGRYGVLPSNSAAGAGGGPNAGQGEQGLGLGWIGTGGGVAGQRLGP